MLVLACGTGWGGGERFLVVEYQDAYASRKRSDGRILLVRDRGMAGTSRFRDADSNKRMSSGSDGEGYYVAPPGDPCS